MARIGTFLSTGPNGSASRPGIVTAMTAEYATISAACATTGGVTARRRSTPNAKSSALAAQSASSAGSRQVRGCKQREARVQRMDERAGDGRPDPHDRQRAAQQRATPHRERIATQRGGFRADEAVDPARRPAKHRRGGGRIAGVPATQHRPRVAGEDRARQRAEQHGRHTGQRPAIRCERPAQTPARRDGEPASRGIRLRRRRPRRSPGGRPPAHRRTARRLRRDRRRARAQPLTAARRQDLHRQAREHPEKPRRRAVRAVDERGTHDPEVDRQRSQEAVGCGLARGSAYRHARRRAPRSGSRAARRRGSTR